MNSDSDEVSRLLERLQEHLQHVVIGAPLRLEKTARELGADVAVLKRVLEKLSEQDLVEARLLPVCPHCDAPIESLYTLKTEHVYALKRKPAGSLTLAPEPALPAAPLTPRRLAPEGEERCPVLSHLARQVSGFPFQGLHLLCLISFLQDLMPFVAVLENLGLDLSRATFFHRKYSYPQREAMAEWLMERGAQVLPLALLERDLDSRAAADGRLLILDDVGQIYSTILATNPGLAVQGVVEQTGRGTWRLEEVLEESGHPSPPPVLGVRDSAWRKKIEPPLAAQASVENLEGLLPDQTLSGLRVALLGFGTTGRHLARALQAAGAELSVYDPDFQYREESESQGFLTHGRCLHAVHGAHLVVVGSGRVSLGRAEILTLRRYAGLASASPEQSDLAVADLEALSRQRQPFLHAGNLLGTEYTLHKDDNKVVLLANGYPVNYWGMASLPARLGDLMFSALLAALLEVVEGNLSPGVNEKAMDSIIERRGLSRLYAEYHG
ncbi:MAG TPA: hypothetical protein VNO81_02860 [Candidatus Nitrosotenuis sp.]|nr:hypothetical protein [Candidatus Nitrosotenuis sp.]